MYKIFALSIIVFAISCKHDPFLYTGPIDNPVDTTPTPPTGKACNPDSVYFQNQILPLIKNNCGISGCHDAATAEEGVILIDYATIMNHGDIEPGKPNNSDLYKRIIETDPDKIMPPPPSTALSAQEIALIKKWIEQGAPNNYCDGCDTTNVKFATHVLPIMQQNCKGCHGANPSGNAQFSLTNHSQITLGVTTNNLLERIKHSSGFGAMPQGGTKLDACKIRAIELWINDGMPNN